MATIDDIPSKNTAPAAGDKFAVRDISVATGDKDKYMTLDQIAVLALANTFTQLQTVVSSSTPAMSVVSNAAGNVPIQNWIKGSSTIVGIGGSAGDGWLVMGALDNGASVAPYILINNNNNAATPSAGWLRLAMKDGVLRSLWVDAAGNFRIQAASVTSATDLSGTVVGTQSSMLEAKNILGQGISPIKALAKLLETPVVHFDYKNGSYNNSQFHGIVADWSPEFAMDDGRVFSPVTAFGYVVQAFKEVCRRLEIVEAEVASLKERLNP